jgi:Holliday junction resolvase RusA-like endonuclease
MICIIEMTFLGVPVPAARTRSSQAGHHYTPAKYKNYKKALSLAIAKEYPDLIASVPPPGDKKRGRYLAENRFGLVMRTYRIENRGDDDNFRKTLQDALEQSGVIGNDAQIDWGFSSKEMDAGNPRIEFSLYLMPYKKPNLLNILFWRVQQWCASIMAL